MKTFTLNFKFSFFLLNLLWWSSLLLRKKKRKKERIFYSTHTKTSCPSYLLTFFSLQFFSILGQVLLIVLRDVHDPPPMFLLMKSLCLSFDLPLHDPSLCWEYRICFDRLLSSSLFKWPAYLKLRWVSISYKSENLDFFRMILFGLWRHHLTFRMLHKWHII